MKTDHLKVFIWTYLGIFVASLSLIVLGIALPFHAERVFAVLATFPVFLLVLFTILDIRGTSHSNSFIVSLTGVGGVIISLVLTLAAGFWPNWQTVATHGMILNGIFFTILWIKFQV